MPQIRKNIEQEKALQDVSELIKLVEKLNKALSAEYRDKLCVSVKLPDEKQATMFAVENQRRKSKLASILEAEREVAVKDIETLCAKYSIDLSKEETDMLHAKIDSSTNEI